MSLTLAGMELMEIVLLIVGLLAGAAGGGAVGYLYAERKGRVAAGELQTAAAVAQQRCADLERDLAEESARGEQLRAEAAAAREQCATLSAQLTAAQESIA